MADETNKTEARDVHGPIATLDELRQSVGVIPSPFCQDPFAKCRIPNETTAAEKKVNFKTGFTDAFQTKLPGGRVVTRQMLNTLGNIGTQCQFFEQCGGFYTFDRRVSGAIGGYPNNALLQFFDKETNALRTVVSLKDDNTADFVSDRTLIDGVNWKFVDDNPEIGIDVDYSDFIDLSDRIFTSTGITDLYEIPYDSYLQMFAVCTLDCESMARNQTEDLKIETGYKVETKTDPDTGEEVEIKTNILADFNGMYVTNAYGTAYLDVHNKEGTSFGSVIIGGYNPYTWFVHDNNDYADPETHEKTHESEYIVHIVETCPLSPLSCGIVLSKGDKIRVRNNVVSKFNNDKLIAKYGPQAVHDYFFDDKVLKRNYYFKFANLYRRRCTV